MLQMLVIKTVNGPVQCIQIGVPHSTSVFNFLLIEYMYINPIYKFNLDD